MFKRFLKLFKTERHLRNWRLFHTVNTLYSLTHLITNWQIFFLIAVKESLKIPAATNSCAFK